MIPRQRQPKPDPRVKDMPLEYLACREGSHHFPWATAKRERIREGGRELRRTVRTCDTCGTVRIDVYNTRTFELVHRHYDYAEGYTTAPGTGRMERTSVRRELFRRIWDEEEEEKEKKEVNA